MCGVSSLDSAGFCHVTIVTVDVLGPEAIQHLVGVRLIEPRGGLSGPTVAYFVHEYKHRNRHDARAQLGLPGPRLCPWCHLGEPHPNSASLGAVLAMCAATLAFTWGARLGWSQVKSSANAEAALCAPEPQPGLALRRSWRFALELDRAHRGHHSPHADGVPIVHSSLKWHKILMTHDLLKRKFCNRSGLNLSTWSPA